MIFSLINDHGNRKIWRDYLLYMLYLAKSEEFQSFWYKYYGFLSRIGRCLENNGR
jgi:hypothetical protein